MAEYWKSLPRKFCDICKCWFADNKASIDFHERGKRHKENAQKRIQEIQKRGLKEMKKQQEYEDDMEKIEKAALAAYEKDLKRLEHGDMPEMKIESSLKAQKRISEPSVDKDKVKNAPKKQKNVKSEIVVKSENVESETPEVESLWYEAITEEGYKYYWNSQKSESKWEPPEEGFVSIEEQNQTNNNSQAEEQNTISDEKKTSVKSEKSDEKKSSVKSEKSDDTNISCAVGPQPKIDPYGQWVTIEKEEPIEYDFQLPEVSENTVEVVIPLHKEESLLKYKEKVVGQLSDSDSGEVTFKKRKIFRSAKNARQRNADDD